MTEPLTCPLCGAQLIKRIMVVGDFESIMNLTYVMICPDCIPPGAN